MNELPATPTPTPEEIQERIAFADRFSRIQLNNSISMMKEPARVAEHNRLATRILTPKGVSPMQQIHPLDLLIGSVTQLHQTCLAILNELIIARGGIPELREIKPQQPPIHQPSDNGKGAA